jgi:branched-chain amino acid transport system permease protein
MANGWVYYAFTLLIFAVCSIIICQALHLQYGVAGVTNFALIIFQAAGAYATSVLTLPPQSANGGFQQYVLGLSLPFPVAWIGSMVAGAALAVPVGLVALRRLRTDYQAVVLLVISVIATLVVTNLIGLFDGSAGLALIPMPFNNILDSSSNEYVIVMALILIPVCGAVIYLVRRVTETPWGRCLRAMRDNQDGASAVGKDVNALKMQAFVIGGAIAGLSGGILASMIAVWSPAAWGFSETFFIFAAVIIGGRGNQWGAVVGALTVPVLFGEVPRFLPPIGGPDLLPALQVICVGLLIIAVIVFRPRGILPERRRRARQLLGRRHRQRDDAAGDHAWVVELAESVRRDEKPVNVLEAERLERDFGGVRAVQGVTLGFAQGRITGLIGPNGAGKSTLLGMLAGTITPTSGRIRLEGTDITSIPLHQRAQRGLVLVSQSLAGSGFPQLTVLENLLAAAVRARGDSFHGALLGRRFWGAEEEALVDFARSLLDDFRLRQSEDEYASALSGGQKRLLAIMRGLMMRPRVLLLDEPFAAVNPALAVQIGDQLDRLARQGMTIVLVEHELDAIARLCDPIHVMVLGSLLAQGNMTELRENAAVVEAYLGG